MMKNKSILVFFIFLLGLIKYILFNHLEVFNPFGKLNRLISWLLILPSFILGTYFTIVVLKDFINQKEKKIINLLMVIPFVIFYFFYFS